MPDVHDLVGPQGNQLIREPAIIVIKQPKNRPPFHPNFIAQIGKATGCDIIMLPMDAEFMMGDIAQKEVESIHTGIHAILKLPETSFSSDELKSIYSVLHWAQDNLNFEEDSIEVSLLKKIKKALPDDK